MPDQQNQRWFFLALYNVLMAAWLVHYCRSPFDFGYLFVLEQAVVGVCALLMLAMVAPYRRVLFVTIPIFVASFGILVYMVLWILNGVAAAAVSLSGLHFARFDQPLQLFSEVWRPGTQWALLAMLAGPGTLFVRRYVRADPSQMESKAIFAHAFQRLGMIVFAYGFSALYFITLHRADAVVWGVLTTKIIWDVFENSRWFTPYDLLGIKYIRYRW